MKNLTFKKLRDTNLTRCEKYFHPLHSWSPLEWGGSLAGEVGEFCNFLKKIKRVDDKLKKISSFHAEKRLGLGELPKDIQKEVNKLEKERAKLVIAAGKEAADATTYLDLATACLELDLGEETIKKFNEVSDRKKCDIKL